MATAGHVTEHAGSQGWQTSVPPTLSTTYDVLSVLGEGTFGRVYLVRTRTHSPRLLAAKHYKPGKEADGVCATALREISLLGTLHHPNIVRMEAFHMDVADLSLVMTLDCAAHDAYELLTFHRDSGTQLPLYTFKSVLWQLLRGLAYLHENWVLHRDLKPSNLLIMGGGEEHGTLKIADFGLARRAREPLAPLSDNGIVVTIWYRAPELLLGARHYTAAVDVWAAGCVAGELLTLRPLFHGVEKPGLDAGVFQADQIQKILAVMGHPSGAAAWPQLEAMRHWRDNADNVRVRRPEHGTRPLHQRLWEASPLLRAMPHPEVLVDLLTNMLAMDPAKRIDARDALKHPFFDMLWSTVRVKFTEHMWLRASRLTQWLLRRASAVQRLYLVDSDPHSTPWFGGWTSMSTSQTALHDFYPYGGDGLSRVVGALSRLRELHIMRCDDLLQQRALATALRTLPQLERLDLIVADAGLLRDVDWAALPRLHTLRLHCGATHYEPLRRGDDPGPGEGAADNFPVPLAGLGSLTTLSVCCSTVRRVPDSIACLRRLRSFTLMSRDVREMPAAIGELTELEDLVLSGCSLGRGAQGRRGVWALPPELVRCPLRRLELVGCGLDVMPVAVGTLTTLEELHLGCNHLTWLPDNLQALSRVRSLSLFSNDFQSVPPGIGCMAELEEVFLDANPRLQFGSGAAVLHTLPRLRCVSAMQDGCQTDATFDFWSENSICFLHQLDLELRKKHGNNGYVRLH